MRPAPAPRLTAPLPLRYVVAATLALLLAALGVPWLARDLAVHYYQPRVLALTHTVTLGWISLAVMGESYQLLPVIAGRPLWSERLARWQFLVLLLGLLGLVSHFFISEWSGLAWAAGVVGVATVVHVLNLVMSLRGSRPTFTRRLVVLAGIGLLLTAAFGLALGVDRLVKILPVDTLAAVHAHFHLGLLGWVLPMVMGVSLRVHPMFLVACEPGGWPGALQVWGLVLGVPAVVAGLLLPGGGPLLVAGAVAVSAALAGHLAWLGVMVRERRRASLGWGQRTSLAGAAMSVPAALLGLALAVGGLSGPRVALAYAVLVLGGWASLTIAGALLDIVPFIVWQRVYAPRAGREPTPGPADLSWSAAEGTACVLLVVGMPALAAAQLTGAPDAIRATGLVVAGGALALVADLVRILHHLAPCGARRSVAVPEGRPS